MGGPCVGGVVPGLVVVLVAHASRLNSGAGGNPPPLVQTLKPRVVQTHKGQNPGPRLSAGLLLSFLAPTLRGQKRVENPPVVRPPEGPVIGPPDPARKAVCITFSSPKAKPNSAVKRETPIRPEAAGRCRATTARSLRTTVRGAVGRLDRARRPCPPDGGRQDLLEAGDKVADRRARPRLVESRRRFSQQFFDQIGQAGRRRQLRLGRARENRPFLTAVSTRGAVGGDPHAPTGQLAGQIRRDDAVRAGDEADQPGFRHHLAGDDVSAFPGDFRQGPSPIVGQPAWPLVAFLEVSTSQALGGSVVRRRPHARPTLRRPRASAASASPSTSSTAIRQFAFEVGLGRRHIQRTQRPRQFLVVAFVLVFRLRRGLDPAHGSDAGAHDQGLGVFRVQVEGSPATPGSRTRSPSWSRTSRAGRRGPGRRGPRPSSRRLRPGRRPSAG